MIDALSLPKRAAQLLAGPQWHLDFIDGLYQPNKRCEESEGFSQKACSRAQSEVA